MTVQKNYIEIYFSNHTTFSKTIIKKKMSITLFIERNNWTLEDFAGLPGNTRINFCDRWCLVTTCNSRQGLGSTRSRMVSQINQEFIDLELNPFNCWITEMYEVIEETLLSQTYSYNVRRGGNNRIMSQ